MGRLSRRPETGAGLRDRSGPDPCLAVGQTPLGRILAPLNATPPTQEHREPPPRRWEERGLRIWKELCRVMDTLHRVCAVRASRRT